MAYDANHLLTVGHAKTIHDSIKPEVIASGYAIEKLTGNVVGKWVKGYWSTNAIGEESVFTESDTFYCSKIPVAYGDAVYFCGDGGAGSQRLYTILDENNIALYRTSANNNGEKTMNWASHARTENAAYFCVNTRVTPQNDIPGHYLIKGELIGYKQDKLTFDDVPTDGSNNPVKSNGVYDAIDVKANKTELDAANRRIRLLEEVAKGKLYTEDVDDDEAYSKVVPSGALSGAMVQAWGGKSLLYNQISGGTRETSTISDLAFTRVSADSDFWTYINGTRESGTTFRLSKNDNLHFINNHIYCYYWGNVFPDGCTLTVGLANLFPINNLVGKIASYTGETQNTYVGLKASEVTFNNTQYTLFIFDLTRSFAGNEPSSMDDPRITELIAYAMLHPEYNAGEIVSADVNSIVTTGQNLWDVRNVNIVDGASETYTMPTPFKKGEWYTIVLDCETLPSSFTMELGVSSSFDTEQFIIQKPSTSTHIMANFQPGSDYDSVKFLCTGNHTLEDVMFMEGDWFGNIQYAPYRAPITKSIPEYVLEHYPLRSAGTVYDTIEFDGEKWWYKQRVMKVDIANKLYNYKISGTYPVFRYRYSTEHTLADTNNQIIDFGYDNYGHTTLTNYESALHDKTYSKQNNSDWINVQDSDFHIEGTETADDVLARFKAAHGTVIMTAELNNYPDPVDITDLMQDWQGIIEVEAYGKVIFKQTGDTVFAVPNTVTYLVRTVDDEEGAVW